MGLILTFVVAFVAIAGVAVFFISETYTSPNYPNGVQVATSLGTTVVNGQTVPHVALNFDTYPDSTGSVGGKPIHPSGNPRLAGLRTHQRVPGARPLAGDHDHPPVRLGWRPQQPVVRARCTAPSTAR